MRIDSLFIYPLKSARGIGLRNSDIDVFGLTGDRRAMLVDESGHFITQREEPKLAQLAVHIEGAVLNLSAEDGFSVRAASRADDQRMDVAIWRSVVNAALCDDHSCDALSSWLGRPVKLVVFDERSERIASQEWAGDGTPVSFADGYQILVTTTASLNALNRELAELGIGSVPMARFRPNIVIDSDTPWAEDRWAAVEMGGIRFDFVKPCARCIITTQDQLTGSRDVPDPMAAMGRIRMSADRRVPGPLFGWNAVPRGVGTLRVDDEVKVLEQRPDGWPLKARR
ncbi:MOSC domain-containing protein [Oryzifoliimicrobium ureilyticus]|uniref:MOSC domain-containing protein n=1 Tax=Oryzifoliimicrobium ureilyticus TaxID=3113724 RepID=UPI0030762004